MKTFKLCSLMIVLDEEGVSEEEMSAHEIPLVDGLIINKEEAQKDWLLEAVVDREWETFFRNYQEAAEPFMAEVTITKRTNEPASLVCHVSSIFELENHLSVHLEGVLVVKRDDLSDMLLKNLIDEGYEGEELYREYRLRKKNRGQAIQGILTNAYEQVKEKGFYRPDDH
ncbi:YwpF-like family protein [Salisediminibacterium halotolerans]|uniref:YwpF-like family protein n=1 Tax=Salisediminibacterium halotolerans TaxID=517425 RepID=UPI000EB0A7A0|nr:YwpF-like family protein [Salisediminibacterium halotolerans]RLJ74102.1 YwpF-like protein [Actinophytocola xinjiangensis]RPE87805.1 YwpF-like protein [Salisediminibacterium halotolerans]TWG34939.1 YwpF-like protein [Salisediminibacterium halotolerans]GEL08228.1 hypothetical protein SHA02_16440 [Salisediminibacterium halotolerans]